MSSKTIGKTNSTASNVSSAILGSQAYLVVLFRLIAMELYKLRRSTMPKVLLLIGIGFLGLVFLLIALPLWSTMSKPASDFTPPLCTQQPQVEHCLREQRLPTDAERAQYKHDRLVADAQPLILPGSAERFGLFEIYIFPILVMILVGSMAGGDYSTGTIRLLFTRGPSRLQFLLAKIGTTLFCVILSFLILFPFTLIEGSLISLLAGVNPSINGVGVPFILTFVLIGIAAWFVYAMMALFFSHAGRSIVVGIVGPLVWFSLEPIAGAMINRFGENVSGSLGNFLRSIPQYFVSNTVIALFQNAEHMLAASTPAAPISNTQAWATLIGYSLLFMALSAWLTLSRDVVN